MPTRNFFELLGLRPEFSLDNAVLEKAYFSAQMKFHPDRFVNKAGEERMAAIKASADINTAYNTLKDPLLRARHLLSLRDIIIGTDHDTVKPAQALLMEVMELSESPPAPKILAELAEESITRIEEHYSTANWPLMAQEALRLGYLVKIRNEPAANS